jgi:hypothetical protein
MGMVVKRLLSLRLALLARSKYCEVRFSKRHDP